MNKKDIEKKFENLLWASRLMVPVASLFSIVGAAVMMCVGLRELYLAAGNLFQILVGGGGKVDATTLSVIRSVDAFLIAGVLLIFAMGIYSLFMGKIDSASQHAHVTFLRIRDVEELKAKLGKLVLIILIVKLFGFGVNLQIDSPLEVLYFAGVILAVAAALLLSRLGEPNHGNGEIPTDAAEVEDQGEH